MAPSDDDLVRQAANGSEKALAELLERHGPTVRQEVAAKQIPRRWRALLSDDDVMQQTYADAFRGIGRFIPQGQGAFARWLATLARCNVRDSIRMLEAKKRGGNRRRFDGGRCDESAIALYEELAVTSSTPSRHAAREEARAALEQAIHTLAPTYRQVVQMYDIEGWPVEDVAGVLQRSSGAVYMLRARAHDQLRITLGAASKYFSSSG